MTNQQVWKLWIRAAAVRCLRAGAGAALAAILASAAVSTAEVEWDTVFTITLLAIIIEALVCLASLPEAPAPLNLWGTDEEEPDTFDDLKDEGETPL